MLSNKNQIGFPTPNILCFWYYFIEQCEFAYLGGEKNCGVCSFFLFPALYFSFFVAELFASNLTSLGVGFHVINEQLPIVMHQRVYCNK